jgi:ABC-type branched-subunit amino acid transport system ATPase component
VSALHIRDLTVTYGGLVANDRITFDVPAGQVVGLIGPNGAGKSTLVDAVCGFVPYRGSVELSDRRVDRLPPHRRTRAGLARTWQSVELFVDLTVRANVEVAAHTLTPRAFLADAVHPGRPRDREGVDRALAAVDLRAVQDRLPSELSLGQRKRLGVARALAGSPEVVLLDEPAAGLDASERRQFGSLLRRLAEEGLAVLLIEHDVDLVLGTCDWVIVLDFGVVIAAGTPAEIRRDTRVAAAYLGDRQDAVR